MKNYLDDEVISFEENEEELLQEDSENIPLDGSPLYPRIYIGDSAQPLMGQFPESEYVDDNISRTYMGLLSGFSG